MHDSKRVVEMLWDEGILDVNLPSVPDVEKLNHSLVRSGIAMQMFPQRTLQEDTRRTETVMQTAELVQWR